MEALNLCAGHNYSYEGMQAVRKVVRFAAIDGTSRKHETP